MNYILTLSLISVSVGLVGIMGFTVFNILNEKNKSTSSSEVSDNIDSEIVENEEEIKEYKPIVLSEDYENKKLEDIQSINSSQSVSLLTKVITGLLELKSTNEDVLGVFYKFLLPTDEGKTENGRDLSMGRSVGFYSLIDEEGFMNDNTYMNITQLREIDILLVTKYRIYVIKVLNEGSSLNTVILDTDKYIYKNGDILEFDDININPVLENRGNASAVTYFFGGVNLQGGYFTKRINDINAITKSLIIMSDNMKKSPELDKLDKYITYESTYLDFISKDITYLERENKFKALNWALNINDYMNILCQPSIQEKLSLLK